MNTPLGEQRPIITNPITVGDLAPKHVGKKVRIGARDNVHTDVIQDLRFITDQTFCGTRARAVEVHFPGATIQYGLNATVEVLE